MGKQSCCLGDLAGKCAAGRFPTSHPESNSAGYNCKVRTAFSTFILPLAPRTLRRSYHRLNRSSKKSTSGKRRSILRFVCLALHRTPKVIMDLLSDITAPSMAMASALAVSAGAYFNAKFGVSTDISTILNDRSFAKRLEQRIAQLGDSTTIYKMLERVVEVEGRGSTEALWFEHKTWTYYQLKDRMLSLLYVQRGWTDTMQWSTDLRLCFMLGNSDVVMLLAYSRPIPLRWSSWSMH